MVEDTSKLIHRLSEDSTGLQSQVSRFLVNGEQGGPAGRPEPAGASSVPVRSPARDMVKGVARAFSGSSNLAEKQDLWEEF